MLRDLPNEPSDPLWLLLRGDAAHKHREWTFMNAHRGLDCFRLLGPQQRESGTIDLRGGPIVPLERCGSTSELQAWVCRGPGVIARIERLLRVGRKEEPLRTATGV